MQKSLGNLEPTEQCCTSVPGVKCESVLIITDDRALLSVSAFPVAAVKICWPAWTELRGALLGGMNPREGVVGEHRKLKADLASC